jgi:hypothetical protein
MLKSIITRHLITISCLVWIAWVAWGSNLFHKSLLSEMKLSNLLSTLTLVTGASARKPLTPERVAADINSEE